MLGCGDKEVTVSNPDGKSLTYNFFEKADYNKDKYTLRLKNDKRDILIIHEKDKNYYEVIDDDETFSVIEKDMLKYSLNGLNKTYIEEEVDSYTDYAAGYLPSDMKKLKNTEYKTGKERRGAFNYTYEKYVYDEGTTTYYFSGKKLKLIKNETPLNQTEVTFVSISSKVDKSKFNLPKDYQKLEL